MDEQERERRRRFAQSVAFLGQASDALWHDAEEFQARREQWPEMLISAHRMIRDEIERRMREVWGHEA